MLGAHVQSCCAATRRAEKSDTGDCCGRTSLLMFRFPCRLMGDAHSLIDLLEPESDVLPTCTRFLRVSTHTAKGLRPYPQRVVCTQDEASPPHDRHTRRGGRIACIAMVVPMGGTRGDRP